jgi:hypothetical protein
MTTRILTVLVAAILVGGVMTAVLKEDTSKGPVAQQPTPTPIESPTESPTETMTFDGVPPFESPASPPMRFAEPTPETPPGVAEGAARLPQTARP